MSSTRPENSELKKALLFARNMIAKKEEKYICNALNAYYYRDNDKKARKSVEYLRDYIGDQIYPRLSYEGWVSVNYPSLFMISKEEKCTRGVEGRLAWIDWMLEGLE